MSKAWTGHQYDTLVTHLNQWQAPIMTIHGTRLVDPEPEPIYDAVGRAVEAATVVENWFNILGHAIAGLQYDERPWSAALPTLRASVQEMPPEHQPAVEHVLTEIERLLNIRNGLVHGVWQWGETQSGIPGFRSQRPPRGKNPEQTHNPDGELVPKWTSKTFTRASLIAFTNDCEAVAAKVQRQYATWTDHLDPEDSWADDQEPDD